MLQLSNLNLIAGSKVLLTNASASFALNERIGIIGRNGSGKSSLFKAITGQLPLEDGSIGYPADWRMGVLEQNLPACGGTVLETACQGDAEWVETDTALKQAEANDDMGAIGDCHERLAAIDGYTIEARASKICRGLGFSLDELSQPVETFSGGWQMRVQLAKVLLSRSELLLLDEPTNHLDLESAIWLESWLQNCRACVLIISHDRDFLDATTTHSLHLSQQRLKKYHGNYTEFARQLQEQLILQAKSKIKVDAKRAHMQSFVDRFRAKASKAKQAQSRLKALEKLNFSADLEEDSAFYFSFHPTTAIPYPAITLTGDLGYGDDIIVENASFNIGSGERLGVIGSNGSGKTTFLKSLFGELPLLRGENIIQPQVQVGYYSQQQIEALDLSCSPFEVIQQHNRAMREGEIRKYLGGFNFQGDKVFEKIANFSGGEVARVALALLVMKKPNILILDEPTNHLDITMREALILALQNYTGTLLIVSHDRHLLNSCVDEYVLVKDHQVKRFPGEFSDYQRLVLGELGDNITKNSRKNLKNTPENDYILQKQAQKLEKKVEKLENQIDKLDVKLSNSSLYESESTKRLTELQARKAKLVKELDQKQAEWFEIANRLED
jgi:ATP-binding cassette subfamily F protein 3